MRDVYQNVWSPITDFFLESSCPIVDIFVVSLASWWDHLTLGAVWNTSGSDVHHFLVQDVKQRVCLHYRLCLPLSLDAEDPTVLEDGQTLGGTKPRFWIQSKKKPPHPPEPLHGAVR